VSGAIVAASGAIVAATKHSLIANMFDIGS